MTKDTKVDFATIVLISGPSGVGKDVIKDTLLQKYDNYRFITTYTTRPRRAEEKDGKDYHFLSEEQFKAKIRSGDFLEWAKVYGKYYGTAIDSVCEVLERNQTALIRVDVQGMNTIRNKLPGIASFCIMPATISELRERLQKRGGNNNLDLRLSKAFEEITEYYAMEDRLMIFNRKDRAAEASEEVVKYLNDNRDRLPSGEELQQQLRALKQSFKIIVAPQEFKGSLPAFEVANAIIEGVKKGLPDAKVEAVPIADGGDGTLDVLSSVLDVDRYESTVTGPLGRPVSAPWLVIKENQTVIIETAKVSGLSLLNSNELNPLHATTYGLGELIKSCMDKNYRKFLIGIGGTATNDGGIGMAQALGVRLLNQRGEPVEPNGAGLFHLDSVDMSEVDERLEMADITAFCDVTNPLYGPDGAAHVFARQKGASLKEVRLLDKGLERLGTIIKDTMDIDMMELAGSGAGGGLGAGLMAFAKAKFRLGAELILDILKFKEHLMDASLLIVAEGSFDSSSAFNKSPIAAARIAERMSVPVVGICGNLGEGYQVANTNGINAVFSIINRPMDLSRSMRDARVLTVNCAEQIARMIAAFGDHRS